MQPQTDAHTNTFSKPLPFNLFLYLTAVYSVSNSSFSPSLSLCPPSSIRRASALSPSPPLFNPSRSGSVAAKGGVAHLLPHHRSACQRTRRCCLFPSVSLHPFGRRRSDGKVVKQESTASEPQLRRLERLDAIKGTLRHFFVFLFFVLLVYSGSRSLQPGNICRFKVLFAFFSFCSRLLLANSFVVMSQRAQLPLSQVTDRPTCCLVCDRLTRSQKRWL